MSQQNKTLANQIAYQINQDKLNKHIKINEIISNINFCTSEKLYQYINLYTKDYKEKYDYMEKSTSCDKKDEYNQALTIAKSLDEKEEFFFSKKTLAAFNLYLDVGMEIRKCRKEDCSMLEIQNFVDQINTKTSSIRKMGL